MMQFDITHEAKERFKYPAFREIERARFIEGAQWAQERVIQDALEFIDEFFGNGGTVDDWLRDNPNLEQGRVEFIKRMHN